MASAYYSRMLLSFLALAGLAVGKFARMLFSFLFRHLFLFVQSLTGRDSIHADATVLFNLLWRNLEEVSVKRECFSASCFGLSACGGNHKALEWTKTNTLQMETNFRVPLSRMEHVFANAV